MRNIGSKLVICGMLLVLRPFLGINTEIAEFTYDKGFLIGIAIMLFGIIINAINNDSPYYNIYQKKSLRDKLF